MQMGMMWQLMKPPVLTPMLRLSVLVCLLMSVMLLVEKMYMAIVVVVVKLLGRRPEKCYKWEPMRDDVRLGDSSSYPKVLIQIPMYNEKEVYQLSIGAACGLTWPSDRIIIQVLDDSTDPAIKRLVELECLRWASTRMNIKYETRENNVRNGYKAGAQLRQGVRVRRHLRRRLPAGARPSPSSSTTPGLASSRPDGSLVTMILNEVLRRYTHR